MLSCNDFFTNMLKWSRVTGWDSGKKSDGNFWRKKIELENQETEKKSAFLRP